MAKKKQDITDADINAADDGSLATIGELAIVAHEKTRALLQAQRDVTDGRLGHGGLLELELAIGVAERDLRAAIEAYQQAQAKATLEAAVEDAHTPSPEVG